MTEDPKKILLIGDHALFSQALGHVLLRHLVGDTPPEDSTRIATLYDLLDGRVDGGPFGLAVVDLNLTGGPGAEAVRKIKASFPGTPVAVLGGARDREAGLAAGADEAVGADASLEEVIDRLAGLAPGYRGPAILSATHLPNGSGPMALGVLASTTAHPPAPISPE